MRWVRRRAVVARWAGIVLCVLLGAAWWIGRRWDVTWNISSSYGISLTRSAIVVGRFDVPLMDRLGIPHSSEPSSVISYFRPLGREEPLWLTDYYASGLPPIWEEVAVPVWMLLALAVVPTGLLWRAEFRAARRRALVGRCGACGYDRAGLDAAAVCPECGAAG